jgi:hypothetical protein
LNAVATDVQKVGAWSASAIGCWPFDCCVPGAFQCRSTIVKRPCAWSFDVYCTMACWYALPLTEEATPLMPSQQSSLSGMRTVLTWPQVSIAVAIVSGSGPSKMEPPLMQSYSVPEWSTPSRRVGLPW